MTIATFYHAGCPVCVNAEQNVLDVLDKNQTDLTIIDLGEDKTAIARAEQLGVESVPALVLDDQVFHINFGASVADLK